VDRLAGHFTALLAELVAKPEQPLSEVAFLSEPERHQIALEWGIHPGETGLDAALHELFEKQAARTPDATALVWHGPAGIETLTYADLDARAEGLADRLRELGVGPDRPVAVFAASSPELVTAMIATWKAGGVYLPLDPAYPAERLAFLLEDSGAQVVLVQGGKEERLPPIAGSMAVESLAGSFPAVSPGARSRAVPESLAWITYTSGSTGQPKGVGVDHRTAARHLRTAAEVWGLCPGERMLQLASPSFDASLEDMVPPLISGAAVVLRGEEMWEPSRLSQLAVETGLTVIDLPMAYWHAWVQEARGAELPEGSRLRLVCAGGEAMSPEVARLWFASPLARLHLQNGYGPTEAVISATLPEVAPPAPADLSVPIGRPLPGRSARVLDHRGQAAPAGVPGELSLGGLLARGYLGRPALTAERFVPDPSGEKPGERLYRTGDLVRLLPDGRIDFVGRTDRQIKLRGFRIELDEIEKVMTEFPGVSSSAATVRNTHGT
jgi:amino acid adenylation domain-containing protein